MLAVDYRGDYYPCIRFMETSLNGEQEPYKIGSLQQGLGQTKTDKEALEKLQNVSKMIKSPEKCINCKINSGCSWCIGYCYQKLGTLTERVTYICDVHKAGALATKYLAKRTKDQESFNKININYSEVEDIISFEEFKFITQWED